MICDSCGRDVIPGPWCTACGEALDGPSEWPAAPPASPPMSSSASAAAPPPSSPVGTGPASAGWVRPGPPPPPLPAPPGAPLAGPSAPTGSPVTVCQQCGAIPVASASFRSVLGVILLFWVRTTTGTWCRDCGRSIGRSEQNRTLLTGWWGVISGVVNVVNVLANASLLLRFGRLGAPTGGAQASRLEPGRPALLRPGALVLLVGAVLVGGLVVVGSRQPPFGVEVGDCYEIQRGGRIRSVDCTERHDGRVVGLTRNTGECPDTADLVLQDRDDEGRLVLCLSERP